MTADKCKRCKSCLFFCAYDKSCDYMSIAGHSRGEPVSEKCSCWRKRDTRLKARLTARRRAAPDAALIGLIEKFERGEKI